MERATNESLTVTFASKVAGVPDLKVTEGEEMIIGRNPLSRIKNIKCPRKLYQIELRAEESNWFVFLTNLKTKETGLLKDGRTIKGPGFEYQVVFEKSSLPNESTNGDGNSCLIDKRNINSEDENCISPSKRPKLSETRGEESPAKQQQSLGKSMPAFQWETIDDGSVQVCTYLGGGKHSAKIAAFDFDGTLVNVKSGAKFPKDGNDWKLFDKGMPIKIKKYVNDEDDGHRFVLFSNQKGISTGHTPFEHVKQRIESALQAIDAPCTVFLALRDNIYRKPRPGMLYLLQNCYSDTLLNLGESFYVGDAAGRKTSLNKDHSCGDLLFAINTGIPFLTPEQFMAGKRPKKIEDISLTLHNLPFFNPRSLKDKKDPFAIEIGQDGSEESKFENITQLLQKIDSTIDGSQCIIFIGLPASGKSTFYHNHLKAAGYSRINRDELGTMDRCEKEFDKIVKSNVGKKVKIVIDNLNVDDNTRNPWLNICQNSGLISIAFQFNIGREHAIHNNTYRKLLNQMCKDSASPPVPDWLISKHAKNFVAPTYKEGFKLIFKLNFAPNFGDKDDREIELYYMYLNER